VRLVIIDDHEIVRAGLRAMLPLDPAIEIVGEADSGMAAMQVIRRTLPDVAISDFRLPDIGGDELCRRIRSGFPSTAVIILTTYLSEEIVRQIKLAGASGFVTKAAGLAELRRALAEVQRGGPSLLQSQSAEGIVKSLQLSAADTERPQLTPQQEHVVELMAQGLTYAQIAKRMLISESTVRFHIQGSKSRLGVRTKAELIATAIRGALIAPGPDPAG
jgi:DNA-binding NarL/FixJ family response regulator